MTNKVTNPIPEQIIHLYIRELVTNRSAMNNKISPPTARTTTRFYDRMIHLFELLDWQQQIDMSIRYKPFFEIVRQYMDDEQILAVLISS